MELREKIARAIKTDLERQGVLYVFDDADRDDPSQFYMDTGAQADLAALADSILAIPELAEALAARQPIYILGEGTEESYGWPGKPDGVRRIKPPNA